MWRFEEFQGALNYSPMTPREASLSDTSDRCCFSSMAAIVISSLNATVSKGISTKIKFVNIVDQKKFGKVVLHWETND